MSTMPTDLLNRLVTGYPHLKHLESNQRALAQQATLLAALPNVTPTEYLAMAELAETGTATFPTAAKRLSSYQRLILELEPGTDHDPRHIEAYMRLEHPTLDGLSRAAFHREVLIALDCLQATTKQDAEALAQSFGL